MLLLKNTVVIEKAEVIVIHLVKVRGNLMVEPYEEKILRMLKYQVRYLEPEVREVPAVRLL